MAGRFALAAKLSSVVASSATWSVTEGSAVATLTVCTPVPAMAKTILSAFVPLVVLLAAVIASRRLMNPSAPRSAYSASIDEASPSAMSAVVSTTSVFTVSLSAFCTDTSVGSRPSNRPSALTAGARTTVDQTSPSASESSAPVTVTVWATFQLAAVKVSDDVPSDSSEASDTLSPIVTSAVGAVDKTTLNWPSDCPSLVLARGCTVMAGSASDAMTLAENSEVLP